MVAGLDKFLGIEKQKRIGMTQTRASDIAQANNNMFSEYVIPAGKPVNIFPVVTQFKTSCPTPGKPCVVTSENMCKVTREPNKFFAFVELPPSVYIRVMVLDKEMNVLLFLKLVNNMNIFRQVVL